MDFSPEWLSDPEIFAVNRLPAAAQLRLQNGRGEALEQSLNGRWAFHWAEDWAHAPKNPSALEAQPDGWEYIDVPGVIQLQGNGRWGLPQYVNTQYPWDGHEALRPGQIPARNPVGTYLREFTVPKGWVGPVQVRFDGAQTALAVYCNGSFVGYSEDSFTPAAFDLTPYLDRQGPNWLAAQVFAFSSASWLEDQDYWRFSGLFRGVALSTRAKTHLEDVFVKTECTPEGNAGVLRVELRLSGSLAGSVQLLANGECAEQPIQGETMALSLSVAKPRLWSAEEPNLYPLELRVLTPQGEVLEQTSLKAGFRSVTIENGILRLNHQRLVFKGVNRHEWNCRTGRSITLEDMKADLLAMKRANINAVRTSHYPNRTEWYELCDEYGLYVIDEANLETHGTWQGPAALHPETALPGGDPRWRAAVLDRAQSLLERDKNHPCVLLWSCGNESGGGENLFAVSEYFRRRDPSRPVHYEGIFHDRSYPATSDVESQMYTPAAAIAAFLETDPQGREKPFICCEYAHAMGNSCGGVAEYTALCRRYPNYQGGFVWDWIDQCLETVTLDGQSCFAYGGDFDDRPTDGAFCGNGLLFADRTPSPKLAEIRALYQPVRLLPDEEGITLVNEALFTDLTAYTLQVELHRQGRPVQSCRVAAAAAPGQSTRIPLPFAVPQTAGEYTVTAELRLKDETPWAGAGFCVARGQCVVKRQAPDAVCAAPVRLIEGEWNFGVCGEGFELLISRKEGLITSYRLQGVECLRGPVRLNFWRAPTDNDLGWDMPFELGLWRMAGQNARCLDCRACAEQGRVTIRADYALPAPAGAVVSAVYQVTGDGRVAAELTWKGEAALAPEFGLLFTLPKRLSRVSYYGRGPEENYCDRHAGAPLGLWSFEAADNLTPYHRPQECGNRTGVRQATVTNAQGAGLSWRALGGEALDVSVLPYTPLELEAAEHPYELPPPVKTVVRCSGGQMGLGGDDSWGARVHESHLCRLWPGRTLRLAFGGAAAPL